MAKLALAGGELVVYGIAEERMDEAERRLLTEDVRPRQLRRRGGGGVFLELREGRDERKLDAIA
jgi:hypothetical protein